MTEIRTTVLFWPTAPSRERAAPLPTHRVPPKAVLLWAASTASPAFRITRARGSTERIRIWVVHRPKVSPRSAQCCVGTSTVLSVSKRRQATAHVTLFPATEEHLGTLNFVSGSQKDLTDQPRRSSGFLRQSTVVVIRIHPLGVTRGEASVLQPPELGCQGLGSHRFVSAKSWESIALRVFTTQLVRQRGCLLVRSPRLC